MQNDNILLVSKCRFVFTPERIFNYLGFFYCLHPLSNVSRKYLILLKYTKSILNFLRYLKGYDLSKDIMDSFYKNWNIFLLKNRYKMAYSNAFIPNGLNCLSTF